MYKGFPGGPVSKAWAMGEWLRHSSIAASFLTRLFGAASRAEVAAWLDANYV